MTKWADYGISAVKYNKIHTRIESVLQHVDNGESMGDPMAVTRYAVVDNIILKKSYCTIKKKDGKWQKGDDVIMYKLDNEYFIRTDGNQTKSDNLGELPEF